MANMEQALAEARSLVNNLEACQAADTPPSMLTHMQLLKQTNQIRDHIESPYDKATRWFQTCTVSASTFILLRLKILPQLPPPGSEKGVPASKLAQDAHIDTSVVTRAMRTLIMEGLAEETGPDEYAHNHVSAAFGPEGLGNFVCICDEFMKTWLHMPEYLRNHAAADLYDLKKSPYACSMGHEGKTYYDVLNLDPEERDLWNRTMQMMEADFPILGMFDFEAAEKEARKNDPEKHRVFMVDVAGGRGQALQTIRKGSGGLEGLPLVLQDLPEVVNSLDQASLPGVELMKYDIFTPQPVENAHIYFMRRLLHDFYNPVCVDILRNTVSAMGPTSRLLICDMLVPATVNAGGDGVLYWLDMALMAIGGKEKTKAEFQDILDQAGLELVKIYPAPFGDTVTLETRLKRDNAQNVEKMGAEGDRVTDDRVADTESQKGGTSQASDVLATGSTEIKEPALQDEGGSQAGVPTAEQPSHAPELITTEEKALGDSEMGEEAAQIRPAAQADATHGTQTEMVPAQDVTDPVTGNGNSSGAPGTAGPTATVQTESVPFTEPSAAAAASSKDVESLLKPVDAGIQDVPSGEAASGLTSGQSGAHAAESMTTSVPVHLSEEPTMHTQPTSQTAVSASSTTESNTEHTAEGSLDTSNTGPTAQDKTEDVTVAEMANTQTGRDDVTEDKVEEVINKELQGEGVPVASSVDAASTQAQAP